MNKLPAKQIYLSTILIIGIIAASIYSTYAIFTYEAETKNILNIHTPNSLQISVTLEEYKQITIKENTTKTIDIDIENPYDYETCYSIWYKIISNNKEKIQIFENSNSSITTSGILQPKKTIRVPLVIINDNEDEVTLNIGINSSKKETESCSLNISNDKQIINISYNDPKNLNDTILTTKDNKKEEPTNYLTYKNIKEKLTYNQTDSLYVSVKFNYNDELFTLDNPSYITLKDIYKQIKEEQNTLYFCMNSDKCNILYKINEIEEIASLEQETIKYNILNYDKLIGYTNTTSGLRKINETDYVFYGDNPSNFIYYNCSNDIDTNTCELWRIVGLFYNKEENKYNTKIIKNNSIGKYQINNTLYEESNNNNWNKTTINKYLNEEYKFINNSDMYITKHNQSLQNINTTDIELKTLVETDNKTNSKVNLITLSDYLYTSSCEHNKINEYTEECLKNNWLNNIEINYEWTQTSKYTIKEENEEEQEEIQKTEVIETNQNYSVGGSIIAKNITESLDIRPVVYLKSRMLLISGTGTLENPYIIK